MKCKRQKKDISRLVSPQQKAQVCGSFVGTCKLSKEERLNFLRGHKLMQKQRAEPGRIKPLKSQIPFCFRAGWACPLCAYVVDNAERWPDRKRAAHLRSHGAKGRKLLTQKQRMLDGGYDALKTARITSISSRVEQRKREIEFWNSTRPVFAHNLVSLGVNPKNRERFGCDNCDIGNMGIVSKLTQRCRLFDSICQSGDALEYIKDKPETMLKEQLSAHLLKVKEDMKDYARTTRNTRNRLGHAARNLL
jgi:hypothetical protein